MTDNRPTTKTEPSGKIHVRTDDGWQTFDDAGEAEEMALAVLRETNGESVLLDAYETGQERGRQYGPPDENFEAAADLKGAYLGTDMDAFDYAVEMILAKIARLQTGGRDRDSVVDICGYARAAAIVEGMEGDR